MVAEETSTQGAGARPTGMLARLAAAAREADLPVILAAMFGTRVVFLVAGLIGVHLLKHSYIIRWWDATRIDAINIWCRWDAFWYFSIARDGYTLFPDKQCNVAFFPVYPMLIRPVAWLLGGSDLAYIVAGLIVSNVALVAALLYLSALVRARTDRSTARRAVFYLLIFPTGFFLSAHFSESVFLALTVAAFYHAERRQWWLAGAMAALSSGCRPVGVLVVAPLAYEYLRQRGFSLRQVRADVLALGLAPFGLVAFMAFLWRRFGDPLWFIHIEARWGRHVGGPWALVNHFAGQSLVWHGPDRSMLDLAFMLFATVLLALSYRRLSSTYILFLIVCLLGPVSTGRLQSMMRYELAWFPLFILLAHFGRSVWFDRAYTFAAAALGGLFMAMFAAGYWVA